MYILGLNLGHDPSAVLIDFDGRVLSGIHEARITRNKKERRFPFNSIRYVLQEANLNPEDISEVAYTNYDEDKLSNIRDKYLGGIGQYSLTCFDLLKQNIAALGLSNANLRRINHHHAHACSAFYASSMTAEYIVTCDGFGDGESLTIRKISNGKVQTAPDVSLNLTSSLGLLYQYVTGALGFSMLAEEWKLLGLENEGDFTQVETIFADLINFDEDGFSWNVAKLEPWLTSSAHEQVPMSIANALRLYLEYSCPKYDKKDIAAGVQKLTERALLSVLGVHLNVKPSIVALGGGLFLNVRLNRIISELPSVKDIFIFPAAGDGGNAIGSALACLQALKEKLPILEFSNICWGRDYSYKYDEVLRKRHVAYRVEKDIKVLVDNIKNGRVVALFSEGSEHGPRALLNRSFVCSAHSKRATEQLNSALNRDFFMPFGCTLLASEFEEYVSPSSMGNCMNYMLIAPQVNDIFAQKFPAVCHSTREGGWSTRPQLIYPTDGWKFELLSELKRVTGSSVVINTSFNLHGEPIVESPEDAINTFFSANIAHSSLMLGNNYIQLEDNKNLTSPIDNTHSNALNSVSPRRRLETVFVSFSKKACLSESLKASLLEINAEIVECQMNDSNRDKSAFLLSGTEITRLVLGWKNKLTDELKSGVHVCVNKLEFIDVSAQLGINYGALDYNYYGNLLIESELDAINSLHSQLVRNSKLSLAGIILPIEQLLNENSALGKAKTSIATVFGTKVIDKRTNGSVFIYSPFGLAFLHDLIRECELDIELNNWLAVREKGAILVFAPDSSREDFWLEDITHFCQFGLDGLVFNSPRYSVIQTKKLFELAKEFHLSSIGGSENTLCQADSALYGCQNMALERFVNRFPGIEIR